MIDFKTIADNADLIINGYAFTKSGDYIRVLNLNRPNKALVLQFAPPTAKDSPRKERLAPIFVASEQGLDASA